MSHCPSNIAILAARQGTLYSGICKVHAPPSPSTCVLPGFNLTMVVICPAGNPVTAFMPRKCSAASYGAFLQRIQQASAAGRFHKNPIGPIGANLSLQDEKWALAVEVAIGSAFNTLWFTTLLTRPLSRCVLLPCHLQPTFGHHSFHSHSLSPG